MTNCNCKCDSAAGLKVTKGLNISLKLRPVFESVITTVLFCLFIQKRIFCSVLIHVAAQRFESMMSSVRRLGCALVLVGSRIDPVWAENGAEDTSVSVGAL